MSQGLDYPTKRAGNTKHTVLVSIYQQFPNTILYVDEVIHLPT